MYKLLCKFYNPLFISRVVRKKYTAGRPEGRTEYNEEREYGQMVSFTALFLTIIFLGIEYASVTVMGYPIANIVYVAIALVVTHVVGTVISVFVMKYMKGQGYLAQIGRMVHVHARKMALSYGQSSGLFILAWWLVPVVIAMGIAMLAHVVS